MTAEQAARATHHKNPFVVEGEADGEEVVKDDKRERLGRLQQKLGNHGKLRSWLDGVDLCVPQIRVYSVYTQFQFFNSGSANSYN